MSLRSRSSRNAAAGGQGEDGSKRQRKKAPAKPKDEKEKEKAGNNKKKNGNAQQQEGQPLRQPLRQPGTQPPPEQGAPLNQESASAPPGGYAGAASQAEQKQHKKKRDEKSQLKDRQQQQQQIVQEQIAAEQKAGPTEMQQEQPSSVLISAPSGLNMPVYVAPEDSEDRFGQQRDRADAFSNEWGSWVERLAKQEQAHQKRFTRLSNRVSMQEHGLNVVQDSVVGLGAAVLGLHGRLSNVCVVSEEHIQAIAGLEKAQAELGKELGKQQEQAASDAQRQRAALEKAQAAVDDLQKQHERERARR